MLVIAATLGLGCGQEPPSKDAVIAALTDPDRPDNERLDNDEAECVWSALRLDADALTALTDDEPADEVRSRVTATVERCVDNPTGEGDAATRG